MVNLLIIGSVADVTWLERAPYHAIPIYHRRRLIAYRLVLASQRHAYALAVALDTSTRSQAHIDAALTREYPPRRIAQPWLFYHLL